MEIVISDGSLYYFFQKSGFPTHHKFKSSSDLTQAAFQWYLCSTNHLIQYPNPTKM